MPKPKVLTRFLSHIAALFLISIPVLSFGQTTGVRDEVARSVISEQNLTGHIEYLTDTLCEGRATGTRGAVEASFWLARRFEQYRLVPFGEYVSSFRAGGKVGHNVLGMSPAGRPGAGYLIVAAHFDNLGVLQDRIYPGADSNASGVAALLALARAVRSMSVLGSLNSKNVIFVALDAKQLSMAGAYALRDDIASGRLVDPVTRHVIRLDDIEAFVNLDILGSTLEPVHAARRDYLIMLSTDRVLQSSITGANYRSKHYLDIGFDYYGSKDFTDLFMRRIGDQKPFVESGVPSVLFTSGITMNTNKTSDTIGDLDIGVLEKRVRVIFCWLEGLLSR